MYMDLLISYTQNKITNKGTKIDTCKLNLYQYNENIHYIATFVTNNTTPKDHIILETKYAYILNLNTGDITGLFEFISKSTTITVPNKKSINKKNKFDDIRFVIKNGFYGGGKSFKNSIKYKKSIEKFFDVILSKIKPNFKSNFFLNKNYHRSELDNLPLFELLVDFHLDKKNIKPYNSVYLTILTEYPKKKWLVKNENKFLPAVLDSYGIKSKYIVGELNKITTPISIKKLRFICNLFGEDHVEYLKKFDWVSLTIDESRIPLFLNNKHMFELKNVTEKSNMLKVITNGLSKNIFGLNMLNEIRTILCDRDFIEKKGVELKFDCKNFESFTLLSKKWESIRRHYDKGYRIRYVFPQSFIEDIESNIVINDNIFKIKILKTEEDFITEGSIMKNCLSNHYISGNNHIYLVMMCGKKRINLQYKNQQFVMKFGKANTVVEQIFNIPIDILIKKINHYTNLHWYDEKYDFIKKI